MKQRWICFLCITFFFSGFATASALDIRVYQNGTSFVSTPITVASGASTLTLTTISPSADVSSILISPNQPVQSVHLFSVDKKTTHLKIDFGHRFSAAQKLTLTYLMHGLTWSPTHTLQLTKSGQSVLTSWATIVNNTGGKLGPAHLSLVEGRVNSGGMIPRAKLAMTAESASDGLPSADAAYYRVYDVGSVSMGKGESVRVQLLSSFQTTGTQTLVSRNYIYGSRQTESSNAPIAIQVALDDSMKQTIPAGPVQVYQEMEDTILWVGTSSLNDILPGKKVSFTIGQPVDVAITQSQSNFSETAAEIKARYSYQIQNSRKEPITVTFIENFNATWAIFSSSQPYQKIDASSASISTTVPALTTSTMWYDVTLQKKK